jgi:hypothetical protein
VAAAWWLSSLLEAGQIGQATPTADREGGPA